MANQPFYHLRPNKSIDRSLFCQTLLGLSQKYPISKYTYTGFGSFLFDEFKLFHDELHISNMVSLEVDPLVYTRAEFNKPYNCIKVLNISSTDYISDLEIEDDSHHIFWLDFVSPSDLGVQLSDYSTLISQLNPHDIVRITLNANPDSLGKYDNPSEIQQHRLKKLKERVPDNYLSYDLDPSAVTRANYPITLLRILRAATLECLTDRPPYSPNFMLPLFSTVYADGQQMVTFTGIILDNHDEEEEIKSLLANYKHHSFLWDVPARIEIPLLSVREILEINKLLPGEDAQQQLSEHFPFVFAQGDVNSAESYISYYKYYPNYHQISL